MDRFTKDGAFKERCNGNIPYAEIISFVSKVEDFLEEQGFECLEELKKCFEIWNSEDDEAFSKDNDNMKLRVYRFAKNQLQFHIRLTKLLSYRWQKMKEFVDKFADESLELINNCGCDDLIPAHKVLIEVKDKMQELEK